MTFAHEILFGKTGMRTGKSTLAGGSEQAASVGCWAVCCHDMFTQYLYTSIGFMLRWDHPASQHGALSTSQTPRYALDPLPFIPCPHVPPG